MVIKFNEEEHTYKVGGQLADISVTELLHKHGLAPNYKGVSRAVLQESAKNGKAIHKDIELFLNTTNYEMETKECAEFAEWADTNIECAVGEQMVACNFDGLLVAGTADIVGFDKDNKIFIGDHKTTSTINKNYVAWQVSLLDYMFRKISGRKINTRLVNWKGASKFYCFHYNKQHELNVVELEKVADCEIERLIECERKGEIYKPKELAIDKELQQKFENAEQYLQVLSNGIKEQKRKVEEIRQQICDLMGEQGIYSWETENVKVTRVAETERVAVDASKLKKQYPQVYAECTKLQKIAPQLRIKVRGGEDEF